MEDADTHSACRTAEEEIATRRGHAMEWVEGFYSKTGMWWGEAEARTTPHDTQRVARVRHVVPHATTLLELGCGYGQTAAASAAQGLHTVGVDISDRLAWTTRWDNVPAHGGSLSFVRGDFYTVDIAGPFDAVVYWNGFGIGEDADQRALLRRIATQWLAPRGRALIDVGNPLVRAGWAGEEEERTARPQDGYPYSLGERCDYDPVHNRFIDSWWEKEHPESRITQSLRCYSPADLQLLLEGTGLVLETIYCEDVEIALDAPQVGNLDLLTRCQEYCAVLAHEQLA